MKCLIAVLSMAIGHASYASDARPFTNMVAELNTAWAVTNYVEMDRILNKALATQSLRPYAVVAALHFYVFYKPDHALANKCADEFLDFVKKHGDDTDIAAAQVIADEIKSIPRSEYAELNADQLEQMRAAFEQYFINPVALGIVHKLQKEASNTH